MQIALGAQSPDISAHYAQCIRDGKYGRCANGIVSHVLKIKSSAYMWPILRGVQTKVKPHRAPQKPRQHQQRWLGDTNQPGNSSATTLESLRAFGEGPPDRTPAWTPKNACFEPPQSCYPKKQCSLNTFKVGSSLPHGISKLHDNQGWLQQLHLVLQPLQTCHCPPAK